jgi:carboxynorspermidine decarboxylase
MPMDYEEFVASGMVNAVPSPAYVVDERALDANCRILQDVQERTGCKILLALKAFAMATTFPLISKYLAGTCASGVYEATLGRNYFGGEVHAFAPALSDRDIAQLVGLADHIVFNSVAQWERFRPSVEAGPRPISCGLRLNPEYSEIEVELYNPCARYSRMGIKAEDLPELPGGIEGLHFHTMCEQGADVLGRTLAVVEEKFGHFFSQVKWVNFGGGHHITKKDYEIDLLCSLVTKFQEEHGVQVYLEPGEAIALQAGVLVATVLDIVRNEMDIAILDTSAEAHMPDVLAMPYRPEVVGAGKPGEFEHSYRLGGMTCLAGDVIGDYSFPEPLKPGDRLVFTDMAIYSMVKNTTFNGIPLPAIARITLDGQVNVEREFTFGDFFRRVG